MDLINIIERETGQRFNRNKKICCPFHGEKTPSFSVKIINGKEKYHCFGCGVNGDAIDFIKAYKGMNYQSASKYLGYELNEEYQKRETIIEKINNFINWQLTKIEEMKSWKLIKIYPYEDEEGNFLYARAKFNTGKKNEVRPYSIVEEEGKEKIKMKRVHDPVPYNLQRAVKAKEKEEKIFILEGEKDCDTMAHMGYTAISLKDITNIDVDFFADLDIYFIGDTGKAGEQYKNKIFFELKDYVKSFRVVEPTGIEKLGDNKDITDWIQAGYTRQDLKECIYDYWDIKNNPSYKYVDLKGNPKKIWENLDILLRRKNIHLKYNELTKEVEFIGLHTGDLGNNANFEDMYSLCQKNGLNMNREGLTGALNRIARKNSYNPVKEYLEKAFNEWDGIQGRIEALCGTIITPEHYSVKDKRLFITKWLLNCANIVFNTIQEPINTEGLLVFTGKQGAGKTRWIKSIMPDKRWIKTGQELDPSNKDSIRANTKYWISELGELDGTLKRDLAKLKAFFTESQDEFRLQYERMFEKYPRLTCFYATVNQEQFLKDETGNRRYWTIPIKEIVVDHCFNINDTDLNNDPLELQHLWGEVMYLLKVKKLPYWLTDKEKDILNKNNTAFEVQDENYIRVSDGFYWDQPKEEWSYKTASEIADLLKIKNLTKLGTTLVKFDIEKKRTSKGNCYLVPPIKGEILEEDLKWNYK